MKRKLLLSTLVVMGLSATTLAGSPEAFAYPKSFSANAVTETTENPDVFIEDFSGQGADNSIPAGWKTTNGTKDGIEDGVNIGPLPYAGNSRVRKFGENSPWGYAMYVRTGAGSNAYFSYGELEGEDAPRLNLESGKYKLTYECGVWGGSPIKLDVEIYTLDNKTEITSDRGIDIDSPLSLENNINNPFIPTKKSLDFEVETAGNYVLKFIDNNGWTGAMIANIKITKVTGDINIILFEEAMEKAQAALATLYDGETIIDKYDGDIAQTLKNTIDNYTSNTPEDYETATIELENATENATTHKSNVDKFCTSRDAASIAISEYAGTKYTELNYYTDLTESYDLYKNTLYTDDDTLVIANEILAKQTAYLINMANYGIEIVTNRLTRLVTLATQLGIDETNEYIVKAKASLVDNDELAYELTQLCEKALYKGIATGADFFAEENELDLSGFIKNPEMYVLTEKLNGVAIAKGNLSEACPGWDDTGSDGWGDWSMNMADKNVIGEDFVNTKNCPIANAMPTTWAGNIYVKQELTDIPVGKYTLCSRTYNQNGISDKVTNSIIYITINGETSSIEWGEASGFYDGNGTPAYNSFLKDIEITEPNSTVTIGLSYESTGDNTFVKSFGLYMTGKVDSFDYEEASKPEGLALESSSITENSSLSELNRVAFFFNDAIKATIGATAKLYKGEEEIAAKAIKTDVTVAGSNLAYVDFADAAQGFAAYTLEEDANYTLTIPEGAIVSTSDEAVINEEIKIAFTGSATDAIESINVSYNLGNSVSTTQIAKGSEASYTFAPAEGWEVATLTLNGEDVMSALANNIYTTPALQADATIAATFTYTGFAYDEEVNGVIEVEGTTLKASSKDGNIYIDGLVEGDVVTTYSLGGSVLGNFTATLDQAIISVPTQAVYLVRVNDKVIKILNK